MSSTSTPLAHILLTSPPLPAFTRNIYPLSLGMTRVYSGSLERLVLNGSSELELAEQWTGVATETINTLDYSDHRWQIISTWSYEPQDMTVVELSQQSSYEVDEESLYVTGGIYEDAEIRWPLQVGGEWTERGFVDDGLSFGIPAWRVEEVVDIDTAVGLAKNCYRLEHYRATSGHELIFCSGVGIVRLTASYPNRVVNELWELVKIINSQ